MTKPLRLGTLALLRAARRSTIALALAMPLAAAAQATPAPEATPAPAKWYEAVEVHGLADGYYQVRLDASQANPAELRAFDDFNGFNLGYAKLSVAMAPAPAGFRIDLGYGRAADKITPEAAVDALGAGGLRFVQQAYAAMKLGPAELNVGRFVTSAGAEVIEAKDNWLYSRSLLFNNIPFTHVGARATLATPVEGLGLVLGVNNGWDVVNPNSPHKTGQLALTYAKDATLGAATLLVGKQPGAPDTRTLVDVVAQQGFGPLSVNVNVDYFDEGSFTWWGVAVMGKYSLPGDVARISVRGEYVDDQDGFITGASLPAGVTENTLWELTGGVAVPVGTSSEIRLEARYDKSDESIFRGGADDQQVTGTIAAIAWF
jgi:hypothetical protein